MVKNRSCSESNSKILINVSQYLFTVNDAIVDMLDMALLYCKRGIYLTSYKNYSYVCPRGLRSFNVQPCIISRATTQYLAYSIAAKRIYESDSHYSEYVYVKSQYTSAFKVYYTVKKHWSPALSMAVISIVIHHSVKNFSTHYKNKTLPVTRGSMTITSMDLNKFFSEHNSGYLLSLCFAGVL